MDERKIEFFNEFLELLVRYRDIPLMIRGSELMTLAVIALEVDHELSCGTPVSNEEWERVFEWIVTSVRSSNAAEKLTKRLAVEEN